jgi:hypothetical protein
MVSLHLFSSVFRSEGYAVAYPPGRVGRISQHLLASLASATAAEDRSGPADDLYNRQDWSLGLGSVGDAYREEDAYDEAEGRPNDLDMAWVLVLGGPVSVGSRSLRRVNTYLYHTECTPQVEGEIRSRPL